MNGPAIASGGDKLNRMARPRPQQLCHPDREYGGKGMCRPCYVAHRTKTHFGQVSEYKKQWSVDNRERKRAADKAWRDAHPERVKKNKRFYYDANREKSLERSKRWQIGNKSRHHLSVFACHIRQKYGLTIDEWHAMWDAQGGKCSVCKEAFTKTPHVEHCHSTGKVRGLACRACNMMLGFAKDSIDRLTAGIAYLKAHQ